MYTLYVIEGQVMAVGEQVALGKQVAMGIIAQQPVTAASHLRQTAGRSERKQRRYPCFCFAVLVTCSRFAGYTDTLPTHTVPTHTLPTHTVLKLYPLYPVTLYRVSLETQQPPPSHG